MSAWQPGNDWSDVIVKLTGSPVATDTDPNTAAPDVTRVFNSPKPSLYTRPTVAWFLANQGCVIQLWMYSSLLARWFKVGAPVTLTADTMTDIGAGTTANTATIPDYIPLFLQVTANAGSATIIGMGLH